VSQTHFLEPGESLRDLKALEALEESPSISQRDLAQRLGIALGLTNACLSKMARTGLIKISRANSRSLTYNLTPAGLAAKAKLSVDYARTTVDLYRTAKQAVTSGLAVLAEQGVTKIGLLGANDVAEIVEIVCAHQGMVIACIADETRGVKGTRFMGRAVGSIADFEPAGCEAVIVTYLEDADFWVQHTRDCLPDDIRVIKAL